MPEDRRLAAIMFTDIVGYTALMGSDEDKAFDILKRNHTIHENLINKYNGTLIKEVGDGTLASFPLASDAVRCAIEIQKEAKVQDIPLKIGIHQGEMVMAGADVLGDGVNIASRLQEASNEGCITISGKVYSDIRNKAGIKTKYIGEKKLKNVDDPVKVYEVLCEEENIVSESEQPRKRNKWLYFILAAFVIVIAGILIWYNLPKQPDIEIEKSIAVLPFRNDSPDPENEYFCNGMMETILNHLVKVGDLKVMSRTDVEPFRDTQKSRKEIADELGVANILEASVFKVGNNFRISIQLINPESGFHLWSNEYEGEYTEEIFSVQSKIAKEVAVALKAVITSEEEQMIEQIPTSNIEAYDYLIKGSEMHFEYWQTLNNTYLEIAKNLFTRALNIDPEYIDALGFMSLIFSTEKNADSVLFYANQIIKIDPNHSAGFSYKALAYHMMGEFDLAIESYKRELEIEPENFWSYVALSKLYCGPKNDFKIGLPYIQKAIELEGDPTSMLTLNVAEVFLTIGHYEKAEEYIKKAIDLGEGCQGIQRQCECLFAQGKLNESLQYLDSICDISACEKLCNFYKFYVNMALRNYNIAEGYYSQISKSGTISDNLWSYFDIDSVLLGFMYKELGDETKASNILGDISKSSEDKLIKSEDLTTYEYFRTYIDLSCICAIQEDKECAFDYLEKAVYYARRAYWYDFSQINLYFEDLSEESEYKSFIEEAEKEKEIVKAEFQKMKERGEIDL